MTSSSTWQLDASPDLTRTCLAEMIGTGAFVFVGAGAVCINEWQGDLGHLGVALAHGLMLGVMTAATAQHGGGHLNPVVTAALLAGSRLRASQALARIGAQLVGAVLAGVLLGLIFAVGRHDDGLGDVLSYAAHEARLGASSFAPTVLSPLAAVGIEGLLTFIFVFIVYAVMVDPRRPPIGGLLVGLAYAALMLVGQPLTGAAMNPARAFGPLIGGRTITLELWAQQWVYWAGPFAGALLAGALYETVFMPKSARPAGAG